MKRKPAALPKLHEAQRTIMRCMVEKPFRLVVRCGRRFGKTTLLERCAVDWASNGKRIGWFGPQYRLNTPSYRRILRMGGEQVTRKSKIDQIIEFYRGGSVEFWTLNDEDAGRSRFYDVAILDEASLASGLRETWEQAIAPTLLDRGGSAIMAGTPKGVDDENYFYLACHDKSLGWSELHAPTAANPTLDPKAVEKLKDEYPPLVYQQEFLAEFVDWRGSAFFSEEKLLVNGQPVDEFPRPDVVYAVIDTALKDGLEHDGTAVTYFALSKIYGIPIVILDWDVVQIEGALLETWLPSVYQRLEQFTQTLKPRRGNVGVCIEDKGSGTVLLQQARRRNWQANPIPEAITAAGKDGRALSVSGYVHNEQVKLSRYAYDKVINYRGQTKNHLLSQVCGYRVGTKTPHGMDLLDTFTSGVAIGLGNSKGY